MRFAATLAVLSAVGLAAAQTSSAAAPQATDCPAQKIVDACKDTEQSQIDACKANDWVCLCNTYQNLLTCYNNCPNSAERPPVQNEVTQYCNAAAPLLSSSSAAAATAKSTAAPTASPAASGTAAESSAGNTASASASPTAGSHSGAAGALVAPATGALAFVLGVAGLL